MPIANNLRCTLEAVLANLQGVRPQGDHFAAKCPCHEDEHQSLSVSQGENGAVLWKCHAGCDQSVLTSFFLGSEKAVRRGRVDTSAEIECVYDYHDENGRLLSQVVRFRPKGFRQRSPAPGGGYRWSMQGVRRVLYRLPSLAGSQVVCLVEGEKDADSTAALGFAATTVMGGAGARWLPEYTQALLGATVVVVPDNDGPGRKCAMVRLDALRRAKVKAVVRLDVPADAGKDISDWIASAGQDAVRTAIKDAAAGAAVASIISARGPAASAELGQVLSILDGAPLQATVEGLDDLDDDATPQNLTKSFDSAVRVLSSKFGRRAIWGTDAPLRWDVMRNAPEIGGRLLSDNAADHAVVCCERAVRDSRMEPIEFQIAKMERAIDYVAHKREYSPVVDYLTALPPHTSGSPISDLVTRAMGVSDSFSEGQLRLWLRSCVARALSPGCKVDTVLILQSTQGWRKSSFFEELASGVRGGAGYASGIVDPRQKDHLLAMHSVWIFEWAELADFQRPGSALLKGFLSTRSDHFRPVFGRQSSPHPRRGLIVGTANEMEVLHDPTGERRFWPIRLERPIQIDLVRQLRDAVWAEAVAEFRGGVRWWLSEEEGSALAASQADFVLRDERTPIVEAWLSRNPDASSGVLLSEVLSGALKVDLAHQDRSAQTSVGVMLRQLGWTRHRAPGVFHGAQRPWFYLPSDDPDEPGSGG